ncbi:hypothetical protein [Sphingobium yanoikuyae]|uniref:hypothetical protein n=1 Tax=Sphingobium yanoikuyae TaxID=13690 RepID=UPI0028A96538|nr:hypothetical protein [Sphingobium yanoikuyae]
MYEVFDNFLMTDSWHAGHDTDNERFYACLAKVVHEADFNPDVMAEHIRDRKGIDIDNPDQEIFNRAVADLTAKAWAIREYLAAGFA